MVYRPWDVLGYRKTLAKCLTRCVAMPPGLQGFGGRSGRGREKGLHVARPCVAVHRHRGLGGSGVVWTPRWTVLAENPGPPVGLMSRPASLSPAGLLQASPATGEAGKHGKE